MTTQEIQHQADLIAEKTGWDGDFICQIFLEALTEELEVIINKEFDIL
jgi:hypothetical protein